MHRKITYWEGGHRTYFLDGVNNWGGKKDILGGGDTAHTLLMGGLIGVGTPHTIDITEVSK